MCYDIPDDVTKGSPDWLLLVVQVVLLAVFYHVRFGLQEVVPRHCWKQAGRERQNN